MAYLPPEQAVVGDGARRRVPGRALPGHGRHRRADADLRPREHAGSAPSAAQHPLLREARADDRRADRPHRRRAGDRDPPPRVHDQPARGVRRRGGGAADRGATAAPRPCSRSARPRPRSSCATAWRSASTARSTCWPTTSSTAQATARAIVDAIAAEREAGTEYDIVFFGNESADAGNYQVGIRVAHALGRPCVTGVKAVALEDGGLRCEQEVAGGRDVYRVPLPAVVTVKEGLNLPRYPSVPGPPAGEEEAARRPDAGAGCRRASRRCGSSCPRTRAPRPRCWAAAPRPRRPSSSCSTGSGSCDDAVLVLVEHDGGEADDLSRQAATLARGYAEAAGEPLEAVLIGPVADAAAGLGALGVSTAHVAEHDGLAAYAPQAWGRAIAGAGLAARPGGRRRAGERARRPRRMAHAAAISDLPLAANCIAAAPGDPAAVTRVRWGGSLLEEARAARRARSSSRSPPHAVEAQAAAAPATTAVEAFTPDAGRRRPRRAASSSAPRPTPAAASRSPTRRSS